MLIICTVFGFFNKYIRRVSCQRNEKISLLRSQSIFYVIVLCDSECRILDFNELHFCSFDAFPSIFDDRMRTKRLKAGNILWTIRIFHFMKKLNFNLIRNLPTLSPPIKFSCGSLDFEKSSL